MNYIEVKNQLKYFYLIPVDQIVSRIYSEFSDKKNMSTELLLDTIFEYVYNGASYYYDFIDAKNPHTFFGEEATDKLRTGLCKLLYFTLENNCILNSYFNELAINSVPVRLSAKNLPSTDKYITDIIFNNPIPKPAKGEVDSQFFNNRKTVHKNNQQDCLYTSTLIDALNISETNNSIFPINTLQYVLPAVNFLFMEDICSKFGRSLNTKLKILNKYNTLWKKYNEKKDSYPAPIDQLLFQAEMESIFGFSFWGTIYPWLKYIHDTESSDSKSIKDLEGQSFLRIIMQISNFPFFFGKPLFFRYICYAFTSSIAIDYSYFNESPKEVMSLIPPALPKTVQITNGMDLMNKFCRILNSVSLPVLFSLWNVVIYELQQRNFFNKNIVDIYKDYLENDYVISNYDNISDKQILAYSTECLKKDIPFDNNFLRTRLPKTDISSIDPQNIFPYGIPSSLKESMQQLLLSYCSLDSLKKQRFPSLFFTHHELAAYSPISQLITSLQYCPENYNKHNAYREKMFLINHRNAGLFNYLCSTE